MKKSLMILSLTLLLIGMLTAQATPMRKHVPSTPAEQHNPSFRDRLAPMDNMMNCKDELKLTDEQTKKLEALNNNFEKSKNTLEAEMENLHIDIAAAMKSENYKQAKELTKQLMTKHGQMADMRIDFIANRMKELNAEQKQIMLERMDQFKKQWQPQRMGMFGHMGIMKRHQAMNGDQHQCMGDCQDMGQSNCREMGHGQGKMNPPDTNKQVKEK